MKQKSQMLGALAIGLILIMSFQNCADGKFCAARSSLSSSGAGDDNTSPIANVAAIEDLNIMVGDFNGTAVATGLGMTISGKAMMVRSNLGSTTVYTEIAGLNPATVYGSHVHNLPCSVAGGGSHYKVDPSIADVIQSNEIWPAVTTNDQGIGHGVANIPSHIARSEAQSIVVHIPVTGERVACADLHSQATKQITSGAFVTTADGIGLGFDIIGNAVMVRDGAGKTTVKTVVAGLTADTAFMGHVHNLPCNDQAGGGHYKFNPDVVDAIESNEIWIMLPPAADGIAAYEISVNHVARSEAQSIVIHNPADPTIRLACLDFAPGGGLLSTVAGMQAGLNLIGSGSIVRRSDGLTDVTLAASGLVANSTYGAHVHDLPCRVNGGGGHYKIDASIVDTVPANEIWPTLVADAVGNAIVSLTVDHLARPEAQSIVIHDPVSMTRAACIDL